jgi:peptide/nickel transport system substrate-binding protein
MLFSITTVVAPAQAAKTTLVVGSVQAYPQLNPIIRTFAYEENLFSLLWAGLTQWKPDGTVGPNLAKSWSANKTADKWTFVLRSGAKFSDGTPITSQSVKAVFDYALLDNTPSQEKSKIKTITKVTASGNNVIFDLSSPSAVFPSAIPNVVIIKVSEIANFNKNPSTSGPFMVKSFSPDVSLTIVPNPKYFGPKPKLTEIKFVKTADSTAAVTSLRSGDIDVMYNLPLADAAPLAKDKKLQIT